MIQRRIILWAILSMTLVAGGVGIWFYRLQVVSSPEFKAKLLLQELREGPRNEYDFRGRLESSYHPWSLVDALIKLGPSAVPPLIDSLGEGRRLERIRTLSYAAHALGEIGDKRAVEPLISVLQRGDDDTGFVAEALGTLRDDRAIRPLIAALKRGPNIVRYSAAKALGNYPDSDSVKALTSVAEDPQEVELVRLGAQDALRKLLQSGTKPAP